MVPHVSDSPGHRPRDEGDTLMRTLLSIATTATTVYSQLRSTARTEVYYRMCCKQNESTTACRKLETGLDKDAWRCVSNTHGVSYGWRAPELHFGAHGALPSSHPQNFPRYICSLVIYAFPMYTSLNVLGSRINRPHLPEIVSDLVCCPRDGCQHFEATRIG